jgi:F-type H+-transporting ATPase subunit a
VKEQIGTHPIWTMPLFGEVHADTIVTTWIVMLVSLVFFAIIGASYGKQTKNVSKLQATFESATEFLADTARGTLGPAAEGFTPFFIALFFFIFLLNQVGFLPFKQFGWLFGGSPTADLNTTVAYALIVFFLILGVGLQRKGIGYFGHLFQPFPILFPINLIEELARPVTLALRLFFNIFVGEILIFVATSIISGHIMIGSFNLSKAALVAPVLIQFFNFFVGSLQAFVFTLLTIVYMSAAVSEEH